MPTAQEILSEALEKATEAKKAADEAKRIAEKALAMANEAAEADLEKRVEALEFEGKTEPVKWVELRDIAETRERGAGVGSSLEGRITALEEGMCKIKKEGGEQVFSVVDGKIVGPEKYFLD